MESPMSPLATFTTAQLGERPGSPGGFCSAWLDGSRRKPRAREVLRVMEGIGWAVHRMEISGRTKGISGMECSIRGTAVGTRELLLCLLVAPVFGTGCTECATEVVNRTAAPADGPVAVLYLINCGATTSYSVHVAILEQGEEFPEAPDEALARSVFAAYRTPVRGDEPTPRQGIRTMVRVRWRSANELEILHGRDLTVSRHMAEHRRVAVTLVQVE